MVLPVNWYVPGPPGVNDGQCAQLANVPSRGFRSRYLWDPAGEKSTEAGKGQRYLLSDDAGSYAGRGNTVDEVLTYLRRAAAADGTRPKGTIYFMWNKDIRSATRDKCFEAVARQINALGVRAKVQQGIVPDGAKDVAGMMVGAFGFRLGEIGNHDSPRRHLRTPDERRRCLDEGRLPNAAQRIPSPWRRRRERHRGRTARDSGQVSAPFAATALRPRLLAGRGVLPIDQRSVSTARSSAIRCASRGPWRRKSWWTGIKADQQVSGPLTIKPSAVIAGGRAVGSFDTFIDGRMVAHSPPGSSFTIDTTKLADGYHELRVVGIRPTPIETQGRIIVPFSVRNHDAPIELKTSLYRAKFAEKFHISRAANWCHRDHNSTEQSRPGPRTGRSGRGRCRGGKARSRPQHVASVQ